MAPPLRTLWVFVGLLLVVPAARAVDHTVFIFDFYFTPTNLTVAPGDSVTWINHGSNPHDTTDINGNWASPLLFNDEEFFTYTFNQAGQFPYVCLTHIAGFPQQTGLVVVASANLPPSVRIASPANGAIFAAPADLTITVEASDSDGSVANVQFLINGAPVGNSTGPAFSAAVNGLAPNDYVLTAIATDNLGATTTSDPIGIVVQEGNPTRHPLTLSVLPAGSGSIAAAPPPPPDGYSAGTVVTLTAGAAPGFVFNGWSGAATGNQNPLDITMDAAKSLTANFSSNTFATHILNLLTNPPGAGLIQISPAPNAGGGAYVEGTVVTLTAVPGVGFAFTNWSGAVSSTSNRVTVLMDADKTATATFGPVLPVRFTLTLAVEPADAGVVAVTPPSSDGAYSAGTLLAAAAQASPGFRFVRWSGADNSTNNPIVLAMSGDRALTATFAAIPAVDFTALGGVYSGLLIDEGDTNYTSSGFLTVRVSKTGAYRGTATIGGMRQFVAGRFDRFGYAPFVLRRATLSGSLQIDSMGHRMTGSLSDDQNPNPRGRRSPTLMLRRTSAMTNAAMFAGIYTIEIEALEPVPEPGLAAMQILPGGIVRLRGTLGDGVPLNERTFLSADATIPLFVPLYHNRGAILGWLAVAEEGSVQGAVRWFRPGDSRSLNYPNGFSLKIPVNGSRAE